MPFMHPLYFVLGRLVLLGEEVTTRSLAFIDHHSCLRSVRFFFFFVLMCWTPFSNLFLGPSVSGARLCWTWLGMCSG